MSTFLGEKMSQHWQDFPIWEAFFDQNRIETFVELGTGNGGMALYFALQCYKRSIQFHTFDNQRFFDFDAPLQKNLHLHDAFHFVDLFSREAMQQVTEIIDRSPHPMAIFFDNGDKPREWAMFAPMLSPGDFCIVHDWDSEFFAKDIGDVQVERILTDLSDSRGPGWKAMWFKRTGPLPLGEGE